MIGSIIIKAAFKKSNNKIKSQRSNNKCVFLKENLQ